MKCDDYMAAIAAQPGGTFDGAAHGDECTSCAAFRDDMQALDQRIALALRIPLPPLSLPELPDLSAVDNVVSLSPRRRSIASVPSWLGIAAGIAIAAVVGFQLFVQPTTYPSLGAEILAHLDHEPGAFSVTEAVSEQRLTGALDAKVEALDTSGTLVTYARTCVINGHRIPHLVLQGQNGPITVLLLPDEKIDHAEVLEGAGTHGVILPVGDGSIAIIGDRGEPLEQLQHQLSDSVKWSI